MRETVSAELTTVITALVSMLGGLGVGLGAPLISSRQARRSAVVASQQALADRILEIWEGPKDLVAALTASNSIERRHLLLFGLRLKDEAAKNACLRLVQLADSEQPSPAAVLDAWVDMVNAVSGVYRSAS
jgi:hypothetical protein